MKPVDFLTRAVIAAKEANHVWPEYAAAEAALESAWGESKLCRVANNLFGQKSGFTTKGYKTISIPTREVLDGKDVIVEAIWPCFPTWADSFRARMALLAAKPSYKPALEAESGEKFVELVSKVWATDPNRGAKCLATYHAHFKEGLIV